MEKFNLPYGRGFAPIEIADGHLAGVLRSAIHEYKPAKSAVELVRESIENPIGSPRLRDLAAGKRRITVIASDHTRPVPSRVIMPLMLEEIRAGNPDAEIAILIATGLHRTFRDEPDLGRMMDTFLSRKPEETVIDQWESQVLARVLLKAKVVFVSACDDQLVKDFHMIPAHSPAEALEIAIGLVGKPDYKVTVVPDGISVIVRQ